MRCLPKLNLLPPSRGVLATVCMVLALLGPSARAQQTAKDSAALQDSAPVAVPAPVAGPPAGPVPDVFIRVRSSAPRGYVGQPLTVAYLLYYRVPLVDPEHEATLTFPRCLVEEYPPTPLPSKELVNGRTYQVKLVKKYQVIPQFAGALRLPSLQQRVKVKQEAAGGFFGEMQMVMKRVSSGPLTLQVRELPAPTTQVPFSGAIGEFKLVPSYSKSTKSDRLLTYQLQISGRGNLQNLKLPLSVLPPGLEAFNVTTRETHRLGSGGVGSRVIHGFDIVAHKRGNHLIPGLRFTYFDPVKEVYVDCQLPDYAWVVDNQALPALRTAAVGPPQNPMGGVFQKAAFELDFINNAFFKSPAYYGLSLLALILVLVTVITEKITRARIDNRELYNFRSAKSRALRLLKAGKTKLLPNEADADYKRQYGILLQYLSHKLGQREPIPTIAGLQAAFRACRIPESEQRWALCYLSHLNERRFAGDHATSAVPPSSQEELREVILTYEAFCDEKYYHRFIARA